MFLVSTKTQKYIMPATVLLFVSIVFIPFAAWGATITVGPSDCSAAAVNQAIVAASDGDTVSLSCSGTVTWTATINVPNTKGIKLIGPGNNSPKTSASFPLIITSNQSPAIALVVGPQRSLYRISGFQFQGSGSGTYLSITGVGTGQSGLGAFRIDNNLFTGLHAQPVIWNKSSQGALYGLIDSNTFRDNGTDNLTIAFWEFYQPPPSLCWGKDSWDRPFSFGSASFNFVEDNLFEQLTVYQRHYVEHEMGGRSVIRYNTFNAQFPGVPDYIDAHGDCLSNTNGRGSRGGEIYRNTFLGTSSSVGRDINLRGGQWLIYDNTFTTRGYASSSIKFTEYRASTIDSRQCSSTSRCSDPPASVTNNPSFYPLRDQIQETFTWNNIFSSQNETPDVSDENYVPFYIQANRDYWVSTSQPAALSSYVPYTYPHPLRGVTSGGPSVRLSPPQDLHVVQ